MATLINMFANTDQKKVY